MNGLAISRQAFPRGIGAIGSHAKSGAAGGAGVEAAVSRHATRKVRAEIR